MRKRSFKKIVTRLHPAIMVMLFGINRHGDTKKCSSTRSIFLAAMTMSTNLRSPADVPDILILNCCIP